MPVTAFPEGIEGLEPIHAKDLTIFIIQSLIDRLLADGGVFLPHLAESVPEGPYEAFVGNEAMDVEGHSFMDLNEWS